MKAVAERNTSYGARVIDGDYSKTYEVQFKSCDTIIFLDYSFDDCMNGIKERIGKPERICRGQNRNLIPNW